MRTERVVAQRRPHSSDFVDGNCGAYAGAADHDASLRPPGENLVTESLGDIGKIDGLGTISPDVFDSMPPGLERLDNRPFQRETGVIGSHHQLPADRTH